MARVAGDGGLARHLTPVGRHRGVSGHRGDEETSDPGFADQATLSIWKPRRHRPHRRHRRARRSLSFTGLSSAADRRPWLRTHTWGSGTGKSMQLRVAGAGSRPWAPTNWAGAGAVGRPLLTPVPMARPGRVPTVTRRRNFTVRSSEVYAIPC